MDAFLALGLDESVLNERAVDAWMDSQGLPPGSFDNAELLSGGTQNILVRFTRGGRDYVLRRPPVHLRPVSNRVLSREVRVLDALGPTEVRAPKLIAACLDETVLNGAVFYLMEPISGFNPHSELPDLHAGDARIRHEMGLEAVRGIAHLGDVDHNDIGLSDLDRSSGFPDRQVGRWIDELHRYREVPGYPDSALPGVESVGRWLDDHKPRTWSPGIMHGDYHLANLMFSVDGPSLAAVVDWEMWTIGDPLLDLGWLIATWPTRQNNCAVGDALAAAGGLASTTELVDEYASISRRDLGDLTWYIVLACFKLGILLEGTYARSCAGKAPAEVGQTMHSRALDLIDQAAQWIEV